MEQKKLIDKIWVKATAIGSLIFCAVVIGLLMGDCIATEIDLTQFP